MADPDVGEVVATVWEFKYGKKPTDNILNSRALFYLLSEEGFREEADGGRLIEFTLAYTENTTFHSYGEYDPLDTTRVNVFDAARFDWKINSGTVQYSELERLRAEGGGAKIDLIADKLDWGKESHIATMNRQLFSDGTGNGSLDIQGLQSVIATLPTTGTVGGINRAVFTFWRNKQTSGAKTTNAFDNLRATMRSVFNQCSRGGIEETPTAWITDRASFEGFEGLLIANERFLPQDKFKKKGADGAFMNDVLTFKGAPGSYDEDAVAGNLYFLNSKYLKFCYLQGGWMKMYPKVDPANQLSNVHKVATFGNLGTSNSRRLGVVTAIT
jgi:hypothetical protein